MATQAGLESVPDPLLPETAGRRSSLERLGALLSLSVLAVPALAAPRGTRSTVGSHPFVVKIMMLAGNFPVLGWAQCDGQLLSVAQNTALFSILGTTYGGNGQTTFRLSNLQGRMPMHYGNGAGLTPRRLGEVSGTENTTLLSTQVPQHTHGLSMANAAATTNVPTGQVLAKPNFTDGDGNIIPVNAYAAAPTTSVAGAASAIGTAGGNQPHPNMPPYLALNFLIAVEGIYPSRN